MDEHISLFRHEATVSMMERTIRRLWIASLALVVALVLTNAVWIIKVVM